MLLNDQVDVGQAPAGAGLHHSGHAEDDTSTGDARLLALSAVFEWAATRQGLESWASPVEAPSDTGGGDAAGDVGIVTDATAPPPPPLQRRPRLPRPRPPPPCWRRRGAARGRR